jgi:hypothetical protein
VIPSPKKEKEGYREALGAWKQMITLIINISLVALLSAHYIHVKQYTHASSIYGIYFVFLGNRTCLSTDYTISTSCGNMIKLRKWHWRRLIVCLFHRNMIKTWQYNSRSRVLLSIYEEKLSALSTLQKPSLRTRKQSRPNLL